MDKFFDFYRNVTYFPEYDENSFIGRWLDYCEWNDDEYWKLEASLLAISYEYKKDGELPTHILQGIMRIIGLMIIPNWKDLKLIKMVIVIFMVGMKD